MKRPISERQAQASLDGGDRGWEDGEHRARSMKLPVPPGRSRTLPRHGEGHSCFCGLRKPPEAPWDSSMLAHLGKGFLQNCKRGARRLKPLRAETNNHNHDTMANTNKYCTEYFPFSNSVHLPSHANTAPFVPKRQQEAAQS